jgi:hypothetical protein
MRGRGGARFSLARSAATPPSWTWKRDGKWFAASLVIVAAVVCALDSAAVPLIWNVSMIACANIFIAATLYAANRFEAGAPIRLRRLLLKAPAQTYAGAAGIFCDGVYVPWVTASSYLLSATIDEREPRCIDLPFAQVTADSFATRTFTQSVLIPPNAEDDLRTLQTQLAAWCPSARITLIS